MLGSVHIALVEPAKLVDRRHEQPDAVVLPVGT